MKHPPGGGRREVGPSTRASFRRQVWLEIYLPLAAGGMILAIGALVLWQGSGGGLPTWRDTALVLLVLPWLVIGIVALLVVATLGVVIGRVVIWLPPRARRAQGILERTSDAARRTGDALAEPLIKVRAAWGASRTAARAGAGAVWRGKGRAR